MGEEPNPIIYTQMKQIDKSIEDYKSGRIGFKKAWKLPRIGFFGFVNELVKRDIEPSLSEKVQDYM